MTDTDAELAAIREQFWDLVGLAPGQQAEFGIIAVTYIDHNGEQRFSWRIADETDGAEVAPVVELLHQVIHSVTENAEPVPFDPLPFDPFEG